MKRKNFYILAVIVFLSVGIFISFYVLNLRSPSTNIASSDVTRTPSPTMLVEATLPPAADIGPVDLAYEQGGIWLTPAEIAQIPTNNPGWDSLVEWANKPMDIVGELPCTAGGDTREADCSGDIQTTRVMFAKAIVGMRTDDQAMIDEAKAELDRVPEAVETWTEVTPSKDRKWGERNIPLIAVTANILDYRPAELLAALNKVVREYGWEDGNTVEDQALLGMANLPSHGRWALMSVAYLDEDFETVNEVVKVQAKFWGEENWGGAPNDHRFQLSSSGSEDDWQRLQPGRKRNPVGIMPAGITWNGHGLGGLYLADQYRAEPGPVWPPSYTNYIYEGLAPNVTIAFAADHLGFESVFALGNYALLRTLLFQYSTHDGKESWPPSGNDEWIVAAVMTWAQPVFGDSLPASLLPEPDAPVPWPLPVSPGGNPGRSMGFMYATHYARLVE
ncbi:MAG TPA: hypothetical protein VK900_03470 [Anaerolineales bacterium]|nr:hypothetical protein [Anaerolineales bacterium]